MTRTSQQLHIEALVQDALDALTRLDTRPWPEMFAEDGVQEFPFAPQGSPAVVTGRAAIAEYLSDYPDTFHLTRIVDPTWHHDGDHAVLEFAVEGTAVPTGRPYNQRYIGVIEHRDGRITRYVDYWNPLVVQEALGGMFK